MNVLALQLDIVWENKAANFQKVANLIRSAAPSANTLVVLPEMFATGFSMDVSAIHEEAPSETEQFLGQITRKHGIAIVAGVVTRGADGRGRNQSIAVLPSGEVISRYTKLQPFSLSGETTHYAAGHKIALFEWQGFKISPFVCYDLRFPEHFRHASAQGAELFTVIANWPITRVSHWITLLRARAIENQAYVIGVNRVGKDPQYQYPGQSLIVDPWGEVVAEAGEEEGIVQAALDHQKVIQWRRDFPALADRKSI